MTHYDYLIVGSGLFGATFAYKARQAGKRCLVIVKRPHLGGNVYCENIEGINVQKYGAHLPYIQQSRWFDCLDTTKAVNRQLDLPLNRFSSL